MVDQSSVKSITIDFEYIYPFETDEDYQNCFLSVFGIKEFDENVVAKKTKAFYKEFKDNADFVNLLKHLACQMMSEDVELGLYILFSFDYIHEFLKILKDDKDFSKLLSIKS